ncbi:hypothetical protein J7J84_01180 [bacterium]|nr:hypothetical protein [bacterium]
MEKERHNTTRIAALVLVGVLVIVAAVVWSLFYSRSQTQVTPAPAPPVSTEQQPPEAAGPGPQETPDTIPAPEAGVSDAEETPQEETAEPEGPAQVEAGENVPAPEALEETPTDVTAEEEAATAAEEETAPVTEEPNAPAEESVKPPASEEAAESPAETEKPASPAAGEGKEKPSSVSGKLPKITFIDEEVEEDYKTSRFFVVNHVSPCRNPFAPPQNRMLPRALLGTGEQLTTSVGMPTLPQGAETGDIPLLPLPGETLGTREPARLIGISQSGDTATAMFAVSGEDGETTVMAHPGWLVGNDYVFIGAENGLARMFDRKSNKIIHLATGETL